MAPRGGTPGWALRRAGSPKIRVIESDRGRRSSSRSFAVALTAIKSTLIASAIISSNTNKRKCDDAIGASHDQLNVVDFSRLSVIDRAAEFEPWNRSGKVEGEGNLLAALQFSGA